VIKSFDSHVLDNNQEGLKVSITTCPTTTKPISIAIRHQWFDDDQTSLSCHLMALR
jgi:hypothetical protein